MFGARYFGARYFGERYFGKASVIQPGYYNGSRYLGQRYFGRRYFGTKRDGSPFVATQSAGLAVAGTVGFGTMTTQIGAEFQPAVTAGLSIAGTVAINATPALVYGNEFIAGAPLELATTGTLTFSGATVVLGYTPTDGKHFGGRYFGSRYFGTRYFSAANPVTFEASVSAGLAVSGTVGLAATPVQALEATPTNTLAMSGTVSFSDAAISFPTIAARHAHPVARARKRVYTVKIDEEEFVVATKEEAEALLAQAVDAAKDKAQAEASKIVGKTGKAKRKAVIEAKKELQPPTITASEEIQPEATEALEAIKAAYQAAIAEARQREIDEDDEAVLLLLT